MMETGSRFTHILEKGSRKFISSGINVLVPMYAFTARSHAERSFATVSRPAVAVHPSVWNVQVAYVFLHRLDYFEKKFLMGSVTSFCKSAFGSFKVLQGH